MGGSRDDLVEVVLDDTREPDASEPGNGRGQRRSRRPWSPRRRRAVTAIGLALAVGAVAVRWDGATMETLPVAGVSGVSVSLAAPLHVLWQVAGRITATTPDGSGVLVVTHDAVEARDAATGAVRWSAPGRAGWCSLGPGEGASGQAGAADPGTTAGQGTTADQARQIALCALQDGSGVEALDAATGRTLLTVDYQALAASAYLVDGDVVVVGVDDALHATVTRWSTATGEPTWDVVGPVVDSLEGIGARADGSRIAVEWSGGSMEVDAATGAILSVSDRPPADRPPAGQLIGERRVALPGGSEAVEQSSPGTQRLDSLRVRVVRPDGSVAFTVPGVLATPPIDDGSASGLLLVQDLMGSGTRAYDVRTGSEVWASAVSPVAAVDGRMVGWDDANDLLAVDASTGEVLWMQKDVRARNSWSVVSDGRRLLSVEGATLSLVARSLETGEVVWSVAQALVEPTDAAAYGTELTVDRAGHVVLYGGYQTVVLGR